MKKYLISDLHLGHKGIERFRKRHRLEDPTSKWTPESIASWDRPKNEFVLMSSEEQHEATFEEIAKLGKRDMLYISGDCVFTEEWLKRLLTIRCRMFLVGGNHDLPLKQIVESGAFEAVYGFHKHKKAWLSHAPIHPAELRGKINIHGHTHYQLMLDEHGKPDCRYKNVCMEYTGWKPQLWDYVMSEEYDRHCQAKWLEYRAEGFINNSLS